ncbi:MAG TPA: SMC-Scp complex subunit ScpB [Gemmatimonadota bacterium]|nr:SMC-Scp complex subunit ScpB [Gemmatimonadota bacterium]
MSEPPPMSESRDDAPPSAGEIVEALLFATDEPLTARGLAALVGDATPAVIEDVIAALNADYLRERRAFRIEPVAGGYQIVTRSAFAPWVRRLRASPPTPRLSQAALETLAIVAYKQPVSRAELEAIRGVSVDGVLRTLVERELVTIAGRGEGLGRPLLYGTTAHFLEYFGLTGLDALPRPEELEILFADREREGEA